MTDFATHAVLGGPVASMVAKDKGDISNRAQCAKEQLVNNVKTLAADTVVLSGVGGATALAVKKPNKLAKIYDGIRNSMNFHRADGKFDKVKNYIDDIMRKCKTPKAKAAALLATFVVLPAMGLISYINHRHSYREGQIDQKYTDKARLENQGKKLI